MSTPEIRPSRANLERLLDGRPVRQDALAQLISAARASELRPDGADLAAALVAFRSVSSPYAQASPRRNSMIKNVAAKVAAAKLLTIGGVALAATGGAAAAAASTGHLPSPLPHSGHASTVAVAAVSKHHGKPSNTPSPSASATASESESASSGSPGTHPSATPSPSLRGLCQSWLSRPHEHGKADTNPAFTVLVTAAGGSDAVQAYCTSLLSVAPGQPTPSDTDSDSTSPTESATPSHPTGQPSTVPSASHPGGKPTALPTPSHPTGH
jgi:hypothetical protein